MTKLLILDFDGTLSDTHDAIAWGIEQTFTSLNKAPPSRESIDLTIHAGLTMPDVMRALHAEPLSELEVSRWTERYRSIYDEEAATRSHLFPYVRDTLIRLREEGLHLAIVSNKGTLSVQNALRRFEIDELIDLTIGNQPDLPKKPDANVFRNCVQPRFAGITAADIVVVGDTHVDIQFARAIGARVCWAEYGYGDKDACRLLGPDATISAFGDLLDVIER